MKIVFELLCTKLTLLSMFGELQLVSSVGRMIEMKNDFVKLNLSVGMNRVPFPIIVENICVLSFVSGRIFRGHF